MIIHENGFCCKASNFIYKTNLIVLVVPGLQYSRSSLVKTLQWKEIQKIGKESTEKIIFERYIGVSFQWLLDVYWTKEKLRKKSNVSQRIMNRKEKMPSNLNCQMRLKSNINTFFFISILFLGTLPISPWGSLKTSERQIVGETEKNTFTILFYTCLICISIYGIEKIRH